MVVFSASSLSFWPFLLQSTESPYIYMYIYITDNKFLCFFLKKIYWKRKGEKWYACIGLQSRLCFYSWYILVRAEGSPVLGWCTLQRKHLALEKLGQQHKVRKQGQKWGTLSRPTETGEWMDEFTVSVSKTLFFFFFLTLKETKDCFFSPRNMAGTRFLSLL